MARDYVYVGLWDGWMFNFVADSYEHAKELANGLIFPYMRIIKKVYLKNQYKFDRIFVVTKDFSEFKKLFDNEQDAINFISYSDSQEFRIIEVGIKRGVNIKNINEHLCTIGDAIKYKAGDK